MWQDFRRWNERLVLLESLNHVYTFHIATCQNETKIQISAANIYAKVSIAKRFDPYFHFNSTNILWPRGNNSLWTVQSDNFVKFREHKDPYIIWTHKPSWGEANPQNIDVNASSWTIVVQQRYCGMRKILAQLRRNTIFKLYSLSWMQHPTNARGPEISVSKLRVSITSTGAGHVVSNSYIFPMHLLHIRCTFLERSLGTLDLQVSSGYEEALPIQNTDLRT